MTSIEEYKQSDVVLSDYDDDYDDYDDYHKYDEYDDYHRYDLEYDDYHDHHEYDDYVNYDDHGDYDGDVIAGVTSMEEYHERDVILSNVVPP